MEPYWADESVTLHAGDCLDVLRELPAASTDAVVTDSPYGLEFMGKEWDRFGGKDKITFQDWVRQWAVECLRVLKPGGHLLAFGGTRTYHRLACGIEDAGFEMRDSILWLYGTGFPKSLDVSKAAVREAMPSTRRVAYDEGLDGWAAMHRAAPLTFEAAMSGALEPYGTALKPAYEPIVVARKPLAGRTVAANVLAHGAGALNVGGRRVPGPVPVTTQGRSSHIYGGGAGLAPNGQQQSIPHDGGRWPANVVLTHACDCGDRCEMDCPVRLLNEQSGQSISGAHPGGGSGGIWGGSNGVPVAPGYGDSGGASRFFPTFRWQAKAGRRERPRVDGVAHPTVKPLELMRWLVRLVTPPGGVVLDPFAGSGTTAEACIAEGLRCVLIEREEAYLPLIVARLTQPIPLTFPEVGTAP